jgi:hypothetical protein
MSPHGNKLTIQFEKAGESAWWIVSSNGCECRREDSEPCSTGLLNAQASSAAINALLTAIG